MKTQDHDTYLEWLDLDLEGVLGGEHKAVLDRHLSDCEGCRSERRRLSDLGGMLTAARVSVRSGFAAEVMAALPPAPWQARAPRAWRLPAVVLVALALASTLFAALAGPPGGGLVQVAGSLTDLVATALVTGAGLLGASWKGVGLVVARALELSTGGWIAFAVLVMSLNLLLLSLLRRPSGAAAADPGSRRRR